MLFFSCAQHRPLDVCFSKRSLSSVYMFCSLTPTQAYLQQLTRTLLPVVPPAVPPSLPPSATLLFFCRVSVGGTAVFVLMRGGRKCGLRGGTLALDLLSDGLYCTVLYCIVWICVDLGHSGAGEVSLANDELLQARGRVRAGVRCFQPAIVRERIDVDEGYRRGQSVGQASSCWSTFVVQVPRMYYTSLKRRVYVCVVYVVRARAAVVCWLSLACTPSLPRLFVAAVTLRFALNEHSFSSHRGLCVLLWGSTVTYFITPPGLFALGEHDEKHTEICNIIDVFDHTSWTVLTIPAMGQVWYSRQFQTRGFAPTPFCKPHPPTVHFKTFIVHTCSRQYSACLDYR